VDVWQLSVDLAEVVLNLLEKLPQNRHIRLLSQMESAVTSTGQNIAEGRGRQHKKEFIEFLHIAQGSVFEVITLNESCRRKKMYSGEQAVEVRALCEGIDRKLNGLINSLQGKQVKKMEASDLKRSEP
jgi:four helix bundle protein